MSGSAKVALPRPPWRCYAVGDIHGRLDLLEKLLDLIRNDYLHGNGGPAELIFLGDYVDRGPESAGVIQHLAGMEEGRAAGAARGTTGQPQTGLTPKTGLTPVFLKGNHEELMLDFLAGGPRALAWLHNGGIATLASYGVEISELPDRAALARAAEALGMALPETHRRFLGALALHHTAGPYLFVHAGLRPGISLAEQEEEDLLWIRTPFLVAAEPFEQFVVHGHTISPAPELRANRLGIDTGAFCTGCLTAAVIDQEGIRFLDTGYDDSVAWLR